MIKKNIRHRQEVSTTNPNNNQVNSDLSHYPEKLQQILLSRGAYSQSALDYRLQGLIPPNQLLNTEKASEHIFLAIKNNKKILIIGDFDADGATSSALMVKALTALGAQQVDFLVPDRFKFGYGLSVKLVEYASLQKPDLIITVDNGIANNQGVEKANLLGIPVIITDHHLPAEKLPEALVIVNPNQPDDHFPSKHLAGVGVAFYLMLALRHLMRSKAWFTQNNMAEPNLAELLDLVALGTVADVVSLDKNNRILVEQGLRRIRSGQACFGIKALLEVAKRVPNKCQASDLGFAVGPRLNAAGRLQDMSVGIHCLLADSASEAIKIAVQLDTLNRKRRDIEQEMLTQANQDLKEYFLQKEQLNEREKRPTTLCLYDPKWHQGVIGILASRIKEKINRPVIVFAKEESNDHNSSNKENSKVMIKGSGRSVEGVHIRDVLALVDAYNPELIDKFGGHAMAAGLSLQEKNFQWFAEEFHRCTDELLGGNKICDDILTDAGLSSDELSENFARQLRSAGPWGQGFPEPLFDDRFLVVSYSIVAEKHLKLVLKKGQQWVDAIHFFFDEAINLQQDDTIHIIYKLDINEFRGNESLQLIIDQMTIIK